MEDKHREEQQLGKEDYRFTSLGLFTIMVLPTLAKNGLKELTTIYGFEVSFTSCIIRMCTLWKTC